jgi:hypothetical protein
MESCPFTGDFPTSNRDFPHIYVYNNNIYINIDYVKLPEGNEDEQIRGCWKNPLAWKTIIYGCGMVLMARLKSK